MRRETHRRIASIVAQYLNLDKNQIDVLVNSCVEFDEKRLERRYRHHVPIAYNYDRILLFIREARRLRLHGDLSNSLNELGKALHLIHDSFIPSPSKRLRKLHDELENALTRQQVPKEAAEKGFIERPKTFKELKNMLRNISFVDKDPANIMFAATYLSTAIASSVLRETSPPKDLINEINKLAQPCLKRLKLETIKNLSILIFILIFMFVFFCILAFPSIILVIILSIPVSIYAITRILIKRLAKKHPQTSNLNKCIEIIDEIAWFGLKVYLSYNKTNNIESINQPIQK